MRRAWQECNVLPAIPRPKDEKVPPVVIAEDERTQPIESSPVTIEDIVEPPVIKPQPVPVAPIENVPRPTETYVAFMFYGTECKVRFDDAHRFAINGTGGDALSHVWLQLSSSEYNNLINDCLELRARMRLCDWAYLSLLNTMAQACMGRTNEATMLAAYVFCQSGYKMRIGKTNGRLYLLYATDHCIYGKSYFRMDGNDYYVFNGDAENMEICDVAYPNERALSLLIPNQPLLACNKTPPRTLQSERYEDVKAEVSVNKNLLDFYNTYPPSSVNGDFMTRWAMYANTPLDEESKGGLYSSLKEKTAGLGKKEAVERLLNFVQTAFVYEYDDKVWGHDRAFFAEETLYYPYSDCEDRSILFSRLVRDLLELDVILIYYPGHLATAVCFDNSVNGDYIMLNGRKFVVCDPTYIGAGVGLSMPDMDNQGAKIILLDKIP